MSTSKMMQLSKKRTKILEKFLKNIELVEKGKLEFNNKAAKNLNKELKNIEKMYNELLGQKETK